MPTTLDDINTELSGLNAGVSSLLQTGTTIVSTAQSLLSDTETAANGIVGDAAEASSSAAIATGAKDLVLAGLQNYNDANNNVFVATDSDLTDQTDIAAVLTASVDQDSNPNWPSQVHGLSWQTETRTLGQYLLKHADLAACLAVNDGVGDNVLAADGMFYQKSSDGKFYEIGGGLTTESETLRMGKANFPRNPVFVAGVGRITVWDADSSPMTPFWVIAFPVNSISCLGDSLHQITDMKYVNGVLSFPSGNADQRGGVRFLNLISGWMARLQLHSTYNLQAYGIDKVAGTWTTPYAYTLAAYAAAALDTRIIPNTKINIKTGMPDPHVLVATGNSLSLIKPNPTLETPVIVEATGIALTHCKFSPCGKYIVGSTNSSIQVFSSNFVSGTFGSVRLYDIQTMIIGGTISSLNFIEDHGEQVLHISSTNGHTFVKLGPTLEDCIVFAGNDVVAGNAITANSEVSIAESSSDDSDLVGGTVNNYGSAADGTVTGTVGREAVATGADVVAYTGLDGSNYLSFAVTTGGDCFGWEKIAGVWVFCRTSADFTAVSEAGGTLTINGGDAVALINYETSVISTDKLDFIEQCQRKLMQAQAKHLLPSTLAGSSDDVHAADYDSSTNKLWVGQYGGSNGISVSAFAGLLRCETLAPASIGGWNGHTVRLISANKGNLLLGKDDGVGGVISRQPAIDPRNPKPILISPYDPKQLSGSAYSDSATPAVAWQFDLPTSDSFTAIFDVTATQDDGTPLAMYEVKCIANRGTGVATLVNTATVAEYESNAAMDAVIALSTNQLQLSVTGLASTNINWTVTGRRV